MHKSPATLLCMLLFIPAYASDVIHTHVPDAQLVGSGKLNVMIWDVYDATLYAPDGHWSPSQPFALRLEYRREIKGDDIANRSVEEIRKLGYTDEVKLAAWHSQMRSIFPDVEDGTKLIGVYTPKQSTVFYHGTQHIGSIVDPDFGKWFFDIWLSENTPEPELRAALLGKQ